MKQIILFGAGRSSAALITYLQKQLVSQNWFLTVADADLVSAHEKTGNAPNCGAVAVNVKDDESRARLIASADVVLSLLPPALHYLVAVDCLRFKKHLLTASYVDEQIRALAADVQAAGLLFLCEMGLDPGIDHMSAMQLLHRVKEEGGKLVSFRSHCGGLVAPESDDNPWHYKISWNPANIVKAGAAGAVFRQGGKEIKLSYKEVFSHTGITEIDRMGDYAWYANRDSVSYINLYGAKDAEEFLRTTLRHPDFCSAWHAIVQADLTNDISILPSSLQYKEWAAPVLAYMNEQNRLPLEYLGLLSDERIPPSLETSAAVLQHLLEKKLMLQAHDRDMIIMQHEIGFEKEGKKHEIVSSLVLKGENHFHTAMSKTVGLPLGIAAKLILQQKLNETGLHVPVLPSIYTPVLRELADEGIMFTEKERLV